MIVHVRIAITSGKSLFVYASDDYRNMWLTSGSSATTTLSLLQADASPPVRFRSQLNNALKASLMKPS